VDTGAMRDAAKESDAVVADREQKSSSGGAPERPRALKVVVLGQFLELRGLPRREDGGDAPSEVYASGVRARGLWSELGRGGRSNT